MSTSDLAKIIEESPELPWMDRASCASLGVERIDLFFVSAGKSLSKEAQEMCRGCEARRDCLTHAYDREIAGGYFGGVSPTKRKKLSLSEALELIDEDN
ncbi:MAG: WhiB family transcriptional regulator [Ilumatobacter sp.]